MWRVKMLLAPLLRAGGVANALLAWADQTGPGYGHAPDLLEKGLKQSLPSLCFACLGLGASVLTLLP